MPRVLLCCSAHQALWGHPCPCLGSYSVDQHSRHLKGHPGGVLLCRSARQALKGAPQVGVLLCRSVSTQALKGAPRVGPCSVVQCVRHLMGQPLYCSAASAVCVDAERLWWWLHTLRVTQQYHLASMAARLSSTGISHHSLLPHIPLICFSTANRSPPPRIAPQPLNSTSHPLHLPGDLRPCPGCVWLQQRLSDSHSIEAATDQLFPAQP